jgi:hypothetical protein
MAPLLPGGYGFGLLLAAAALASPPDAFLGGELVASPDAPLPAAFELRLAGPQGAAVTRCAVGGRRWTCVVPSGTHDVEVRPAGYVPHYASAVTTRPGVETSLGRIVLVRGASVRGRLARADGAPPAGPCRAEVRARPVRVPEGRPAEGETSVAAVSDQRGFFQLAGLPPGGHLLTAECAAASAARLVTVRPDAETRLEEPLVLEALSLDLTLHPPVDPTGRPWRVHLQATAPHGRSILRDAQVPADGRWLHRGLTRGAYRVEVTSESGARWASRTWTFDEATTSVALEVSIATLAGRVRLGARPLRARLTFVSEAGAGPVSLESDDEGHFEGSLPTEATRGAGWTVEVEAAQPPVSRRLEVVVAASKEGPVWLDLVLPLVSARGRVVDLEGRGAPGAEVSAEDIATGTRRVAMANGEGVFELGGLPEGTHKVVAESPDGVSDPVALTVQEGAEQEVELVLKRPVRSAWYVTSDKGPVAGAGVQLWIPPGIPRTFLRTDAAGRFEHGLPPEVTEVGATVIAAGHATRMSRLALGADDPGAIVLQAAAGTLVLDVGPTSGLDPMALVLAHGGSLESVGALVRWGEGAGARATGHRVILPGLEPGAYAFCHADPEDLSALWLGAPMAEGRCASGSLPEGGVLELDLPPPAHGTGLPPPA